jgi:hypothetical protein
MQPLSPTGRHLLEQTILTALEQHEDPVLRECARQVRTGRLTLREAIAAPAYLEHFMPAVEESLRRWHEASPAERTQWTEQARDIDAQLAAAAEEATE